MGQASECESLELGGQGGDGKSGHHHAGGQGRPGGLGLAECTALRGTHAAEEPRGPRPSLVVVAAFMWKHTGETRNCAKIAVVLSPQNTGIVDKDRKEVHSHEGIKR